MNILDQIITRKRLEVEERKALYPIKLLEKSIYYAAKPVSLRSYLTRKDKVGVIAEIKRKSPGAGEIHPGADLESISIGYMQAGASALSILTDETFFGGTNADLSTARAFNYCPILRKDFILDPYQVYESRSIGADVILLIAAMLTPDKIKALADIAHDLGMEVLLEVHALEELNGVDLANADLIGVNNRNLQTMTVHVQTSLSILPHLPADSIKVSESGISRPETIVMLKQAGYHGFLIGESFMRTTEPHVTCLHVIQQVQRHLQKTAIA